MAEPLARIGRIERNVGPAGLEDGEQAGDHLPRTDHADADQRLGPDAVPHELVGEPIRPAIQLRVGDDVVVMPERYRVRAAPHLGLEEVM